ncbi:permease-like cell division protein FtsX [Flavicella sp.]|uniref:cell division protein FtsX n=1 Tax=Flavicella sp. TaxID=2957742 RepID=UPI00260D53D7|nr:permease-like cell division protein FtsX [Flavicella sp.]MDG1805687.1 permease-like cell division protein FtsX [Flavicella sp.]
MSNSFDRYQKRRLRSSYFSVILSIALVLFVLGVLGVVVLKSTKIANHFKEQVAVTLFLKNNVDRDQSKNLEKALKEKDYTKSIEFVSKDTAAKQFSKEIGEDFLTFLGSNPLKNSIDIHLNPDFITPEKMKTIEEELLKNAYVSEVLYDAPLIEMLTQNIQKISFWVLVVAGFFTLIAVVLINSSIRLSVYSKRFTIKTMQMVGATKRFIRLPFIWKSIRLGIMGAVLASIGLASLLYYIGDAIPQLGLLSDKKDLAIVFSGVLFMGILVTWMSTFFATQRFLNLKTDQLYS